MTSIAFQFDEESHLYTVRRGGADVEVPGVTRVLDTSGMIDYRFVKAEILERKSKIGKEVHRVTVLNDRNSLDFDSVDDRILPYLDGWISFRRETGFIPLFREFRCVTEANGIAYGMTLDAQGFTGRRKNIDTTVEIKTTVQIMPHHAIQTAGYAMGFPKEGIKTAIGRFLSRRRIIVKLEPTGKVRIVECADKSDADTFLHALSLCAWKSQHREIYREAA